MSEEGQKSEKHNQRKKHKKDKPKKNIMRESPPLPHSKEEAQRVLNQQWF